MPTDITEQLYNVPSGAIDGDLWFLNHRPLFFTFGALIHESSNPLCLSMSYATTLLDPSDRIFQNKIYFLFLTIPVSAGQADWDRFFREKFSWLEFFPCWSTLRNGVSYLCLYIDREICRDQTDNLRTTLILDKGLPAGGLLFWCRLVYIGTVFFEEHCTYPSVHRAARCWLKCRTLCLPQMTAINVYLLQIFPSDSTLFRETLFFEFLNANKSLILINGRLSIPSL